MLTRTQSTRAQALSEVLESLGAQTCLDFEVLLLCHEVAAAALDAIRAQVRSVSPCLRRMVMHSDADFVLDVFVRRPD